MSGATSRLPLSGLGSRPLREYCCSEHRFRWRCSLGLLVLSVRGSVSGLSIRFATAGGWATRGVRGMGDLQSKDIRYRCPVCGQGFEEAIFADDHFDVHQPIQYIDANWEVGDE